MIKRLSVLTAIALAGAAVSAQAQFVPYSPSDANNNGSPYWDNVSWDGTNCNVGYVLNGTASQTGCSNQRPSTWLPYAGATPTTNWQGVGGSYSGFVFGAGTYTFSLLQGTSSAGDPTGLGGDIAGLDQDWGIYDIVTGDTTSFNGGLPTGDQPESAFGLYIVMADNTIAYSGSDSQFALFGFGSVGAGSEYIAGFEDLYTGHGVSNDIGNDYYSDGDYQDVLFAITSDTPGGPESTTPEPMTMSLMAFGLVGLGGASLRRRVKKS